MYVTLCFLLSNNTRGAGYGESVRIAKSIYLYIIAKNSGSAALGRTRNETGEKKIISRQGATEGVFEGATQECARRRRNGISVNSGPSRLRHGIVGNIIPVWYISRYIVSILRNVDSNQPYTRAVSVSLTSVFVFVATFAASFSSRCYAGLSCSVNPFPRTIQNQ